MEAEGAPEGVLGVGGRGRRHGRVGREAVAAYPAVTAAEAGRQHVVVEGGTHDGRVGDAGSGRVSG